MIRGDFFFFWRRYRRDWCVRSAVELRKRSKKKVSLPSQAHAHSTHNVTLLPLICHLCASQQKTFLQDGTGHRKLWDLQGLRLHHLQVRSWTCPHAKSHAYLWLVLHASGVRACLGARPCASRCHSESRHFLGESGVTARQGCCCFCSV